MKVKQKELKQKVKAEYLDALYMAVGLAEKEKKVSSFLADILTESEKIMLGRRILIAKRLLERQPYEKIAREVGVGLDTVFRVNKWLGGRHKGYEKAVEKIKRVISSGPKRKSGFLDYYPTSGMAELKRRYRSYYWLSDLLDRAENKK